MTWDDRLTKGFISGLIAGVVMDLVDVTSFFAGLSKITFFDWAGAVVMGFRPKAWQDYLIAIGAQLFFTGMLGILFSYIIPEVRSKNILLKGWIFGLFSWFSLNAIAVLYKINNLVPRSAGTVVTDFISVSLYGIVLSYVFNRMQRRIGN